MLDPFGRTRRVLATRKDRVQALADLADALRAGREPDRLAAVWVAEAIHAWLLTSAPAKTARLDAFLRLCAGPRGRGGRPQDIYRRVLAERAAAGASLRTAPNNDDDENPEFLEVDHHESVDESGP